MITRHVCANLQLTCSELRSGQSALADFAGAPNYIFRWSRFLKLHCSAWALMVYHETMQTRFLAVFGVLSAFFLFVILQTTTPSSIHPVGLLGVFILLYIVIGAIVLYVLYIGAKLLAKLKSITTGRPAQSALTFQRAYIYATVMALAPVVLIGMRSVGSFGLIDILLVLLFEVIAWFYIWKRQ